MNTKRLILILFAVLSSIHIFADTKTAGSIQDIIDHATGTGTSTALTEDRTIELTSSFPTTLSGTITLNITHNYSIIIDGSNLATPLEVNGNFRHFNITTSGTGITIKDLSLIGKRTQSDIDASTGGTSGGGININSTNFGTHNIVNSQLSSINGTALNLSGKTNLNITNSSFKNNYNGGHGGGIILSGEASLNVDYCTFINNVSKASGYSGGAIGTINAVNGKLEIKNSVFLKNFSNTRGGAISIHNNNNFTLLIDHCYFEENETPLVGGSGNEDGGAVSVYTGPGNAVNATITSSTFYNNISGDDGSAIFFENTAPTASNKVINCTIYKNTARGGGKLSTYDTSGAIQISTTGSGATNTFTKATLDNNTIVENTTLQGNGGGIGVFNYYAANNKCEYTLSNNIILGNKAASATSKYANVATNGLINNYNNIGIDNGVALAPNIMLSNVFGNNIAQLWNNNVGKTIGNPNETNSDTKKTLKSLPIIPNDGAIAYGLADGFIATATQTKDQRDNNRVNPSDAGSVEILWIRFDANGGEFDQLSGTAFDGLEYYNEDNADNLVKYYYSVTHHSESINNRTIPEPVKSGFLFMGWVLDDGSDTPWDPATTVNENIKVKAVWRNGQTYSVVYDGNGEDGGLVPVDGNSYLEGVTVEVMAPTMTKAGHTFAGWLTSEDNVTIYQMGDQFNMPAQNVTLTAQWTLTPPTTYTVTYDGNGSDDDTNAPVDPNLYQETDEVTVLDKGALTKAGFTFIGWEYSEDNTITYQKDDKFDMPATNVTLTAKWAQNAQLIYKANGGTGADVIINTYVGATVTIAANTFSRSGYTFVNWNTQANNGGTSHNPGSSMTISNPVTELYAQWRQNTTPPVEPPVVEPPVVEPPVVEPPVVKPEPGIELESVGLICSIDSIVIIPFEIVYKQPMMYLVKFSTEAKAAGCIDETIYKDLPQDGYISFVIPANMPAGKYTGEIVLKAKNNSSLIESKAFDFEITTSTKIVKQPTSVNSTCGEGAFRLTVEAIGEDLTYQWYKDDVKIEGANLPVYEALLTKENEGIYHVRVDGICQFDISNKVSVSSNGLQILIKWDDVLYIMNTDKKYVSFQWYKDNVAINPYGNAVFYTDEKNGLSGKYKVRAFKADGTYDESCELFFATNTKSTSASVYPNPVVRNANISVEISEIGESKATIEMFDMGGKKVYSTKTDMLKTDIPANLPTGTYVVKITLASGKTINQKLIVR